MRAGHPKSGRTARLRGFHQAQVQAPAGPQTRAPRLPWRGDPCTAAREGGKSRQPRVKRKGDKRSRTAAGRRGTGRDAARLSQGARGPLTSAGVRATRQQQQEQQERGPGGHMSRGRLGAAAGDSQHPGTLRCTRRALRAVLRLSFRVPGALSPRLRGQTDRPTRGQLLNLADT